MGDVKVLINGLLVSIGLCAVVYYLISLFQWMLKKSVYCPECKRGFKWRDQ